MPNTEVKPLNAESTGLETVWEDRKLPVETIGPAQTCRAFCCLQLRNCRYESLQTLIFMAVECGQKPGHENTLVKKNEIHQEANHCRADIV